MRCSAPSRMAHVFSSTTPAASGSSVRLKPASRSTDSSTCAAASNLSLSRFLGLYLLFKLKWYRRSIGKDNQEVGLEAAILWKA